MIDFIIGDVVNMKDDYIIIQNNGIGYRINTSTTSMLDIEIGDKNIMMYTKLNVREDTMLLYGFITEEEMQTFELLLKVASIGPKSALNILSTISPSQIRLAIHTSDYDTLCKAPGVGKKTAQRMVLELKDKIGELQEEDLVAGKKPNKNHDEAIEALMSLGYLRFEAEKAIRAIDENDKKVEELIKEALKILSKN